MAQNTATAALTGEFSKSASFSMEQEFYLGKTIAATVVGRLGGRALPPNHPTARYLRDVGTVVALAAAEQRVEEDRPYPMRGYRFIVVESAQVNAVGMPGRFVFGKHEPGVVVFAVPVPYRSQAVVVSPAHFSKEGVHAVIREVTDHTAEKPGCVYVHVAEPGED